jgi:hypothetical protein
MQMPDDEYSSYTQQIPAGNTTPINTNRKKMTVEIDPMTSLIGILNFSSLEGDVIQPQSLEYPVQSPNPPQFDFPGTPVDFTNNTQNPGTQIKVTLTDA